MEEKIILYSKQGCYLCKGLKALLDKSEIEYEVNTDISYMISKGILSLPMLEVDGVLMTNPKAVIWVNERIKSLENR